MIPAALALTLGHAPHEPHAHSLQPMPYRLEMIVERAWQEKAAADAASEPPPTEESAQDKKRHEEDLKRDREMGKKYSEQVDKELKETDDKEMIARVQRIANELAQISNETPVKVSWGDKRLNPFEYQFKVVQDKDINAFSLPGGFIYVYDGLVKFAESDDELAGVLAHEVAHASLRHVATLQREQSRLQAIQIPLILVAIFTGGVGAAGGALQATSLVGTAVGSGWSVKAEQAADYAGFQYLAKSKYDPTGMLTFMERLAINERRKPMGFDLGIFRTHPPSRERAESITKFMKDANIPVRRSRVAPSCRVDVKPHEDGTVQLTFGPRTIVALSGADAIDRADRTARRINTFFDSEPDLYELKSEPNGTISGRRQVLIELTHDDAVAAKTTVAQLTEETTLNMKRSMGTLSFRVWNSR
ncbi:MAG: M48 family metalloprotease [Fimbriimonas sp.]